MRNTTGKKAGKTEGAKIILFPASRLAGLIRKEARALACWWARGLEADANARWAATVDAMTAHLLAAGVSRRAIKAHLAEFHEAVNIELDSIANEPGRSSGGAA